MPAVPRLATAVVGAGPAGLLFCMIGRILEPDPERWHISLFDKRESYLRTHRLRMDPEPYIEIQRELRSPAFDEFIDFLDAESFRPSTNELEQYLLHVVRDGGIARTVLTVGEGSGGVSVADLPGHLPPEAREATCITVVGADSVHSAVRAGVGLDGGLVRERHQSVARLKITGNQVPERIGHLARFKLAKLLGSALDYRLNPNGYAEVDLFMAGAEHEEIAKLGARPAHPVTLDESTLARLRAPFFRSVVDHLAGQMGTDGVVALQSTFQLEHQHVRRAAIATPLPVFLVGDAAVSLPFFRGMASLGSAAYRLAAIHRGLSAGQGVEQAIADYQQHVKALVEREVEIVGRRNRLLEAARELVRVSARVPFPIQSWFLSAEGAAAGRSRLSPGAVANLVLAVIAASIAVAAPILGGYVSAPLGWIWLAALPVEAAGGFAFETAERVEPEPNRLLRLIWQIQLSVLIVAGIPLTLVASRALDRPAQLYALVSWFLLGIAFVVGMRFAERRLA